MNGIPAGQGQRAVRLDRQVRRLWLQQEPRRRLCAARLSDRLAEGALPARILRRLDVLRHRPDRQARDLRRRHAAARRRRACRPTSTPAKPNSRSRRPRTARGALCAGARSRASARRRWSCWSRSATPRAASQSLDDFARRVDPRLLNKRQLETLAGAGAFDGVEPDRAGVLPRPRRSSRSPSARTRTATSGQGGLFGEAERGRRRRSSCRKSAHWSLAERIDAEKDAFGFYFSAHPLDRYQHLARRIGARRSPRSARFAIARGRAASARRWRRWSRMRAGAPRRGATAT